MPVVQCTTVVVHKPMRAFSTFMFESVWIAAAAQQARRAALTLEEEEQHEAKDVAYGTLLDRLGGAIHGTSIDIYPKEVSRSVTSSCS